MDLGMSGKYAFISGGSHGIGLESALCLAGEGCNVAICGRSEDRLLRAAALIHERGVEFLPIQADVTVDEDASRVISVIRDKWGHINILVNNVGGGGRWGKENTFDTPLSVWQEVFNKNVWVSLRFVLEFVPDMIKQRWGRVVFITSIYGREIGSRPWFNTAKCAQSVLMKSMSKIKEVARNGVTMNAVAPGDIMIPDTGWDLAKKNDPDFSKILEQYPMGRLGRPEEVASLVAFLCSEKASYVNGASVSVDGGQSACL